MAKGNANNNKPGNGKPGSQGNRKPRGNKFHSKPQGVEDQDQGKDEGLDQSSVKKSCNDIEWYTRFPEYSKGASNINWSNVSGIAYPYLADTQDTASMPARAGYQYLGAPGGVVLDVVPAIGSSDDANSPLNVAVTQLYSAVRKANSGSRNYDPIDLGIHIFGVADIFSYLNASTRLYAMINTWRDVNQFWPRAWFQAMGLDYMSFLKHQADFRSAVNGMILAVETFAIPGDLPIFKRRSFIFANIYAEGPSDRDQVYITNPKSFFKFGYDSSGAGKLSQRMVFTGYTPGSLMTWEEWVDLGWELINPFFGDEDTSIMMGDLRKAFSNLITMDPIPEDMIIKPVVDPMFLTQIKNADVMYLGDETLTNGSWDIKQNADKTHLTSMCEINPEEGILGYATYSASISANANTAISNAYLNTLTASRVLTANVPDDALSWELNMEMSRLIIPVDAFEDTLDPDRFPIYRAYPTADFINGLRVVTPKIGNDGPESGYHVTEAATILTFINNGATTGSLPYGHFQWWTMSRNFKYIPKGYIIILSYSNPTPQQRALTAIYPYFDLDNWTIVDKGAFKKMNRAALYSLVALRLEDYKAIVG